MPQPSRGDVHINRPLTNISIAFIQDHSVFGADRLFPSVSVTKKSDSYFVYPKGNWFRTDAKKRGPGTESAGSGYTLSDDTYNTEVRAVHKDLDDQTRENADSPLNLDADATEFVTQQLLILREKEFLDTAFVTSLWTGTTTGTDVAVGTVWTDPTSKPLNDMRAQMSAMQGKTGFRPNVAAMPRAVWDVLADHPQIIGRMSNDAEKLVMRSFLAKLLELDEIVVLDAVENTAEEGAADVIDYMASAAQVLMLYRNSRPSIMTPSAGYTFNWKGFTGSGPAGNRIKRFRMEHLESDRIEGQMAYDQKVIATELGAMLTGVI